MKSRERMENVRGWCVMAPILVYFTIFTIVPIIMLIYMSFTDFGLNIIEGKIVPQFVGFSNYTNIFKYPEYFNSIWTTFLIAIGVVAAGMFFGFLVALALNKIAKAKTFFRTVWYIPALLSGAIVSQFLNIMLANDGLINNIIVRLNGEPVLWKLSTAWMYFWIIFIITWGGTGGTALFFLAGINSMSKEVYEAADIDGVNRFQKLIFITIPLIKPMTGFILITGFIGAFNIFEPVMLISQGGPGSSTKVILYRIYDEAFKNAKYGFACALSVVVMIIILALTFVNIKISDSNMYKVEE